MVFQPPRRLRDVILREPELGLAPPPDPASNLGTYGTSGYSAAGRALVRAEGATG